MNAARVGRPWMRAKHSVGGFDAQARIASGHGYGGNPLLVVTVPPEDRDDQDALGNTLTYTSYIDCQDGATLRVPRISVRAAADQLRAAELGVADRTDPDRWEVRSAQQARGMRMGTVHRIRLSTNRAGECWGIRALKIRYSNVGGNDRGKTADTTSRLDCQHSASLVVPALTMATATDDSRAAALSHGEATAQDRHWVKFANENGDATALVHKIKLKSNRAGACWGIVALKVQYKTEGALSQKASEI